MKKTIIIFASLFFCLPVNAKSISTYSPHEYIDNQYIMLKGIFHNLTITKRHNSEIRIMIPSDYGFQTGKFDLRRPMKDQLAVFADFLNTYPESTISIYGHTDNVGNSQSNMTLGLNRAISVEKVLLSNNVNQFRLSTHSEGEEVPLCTNKTEKGRECNRRVEVILTLDKPELF
ncbi:OmpA family protein [Vibrio sp. 1180_3]|uniref:OmpA family protein n=1 Tax=Vibrio sp. 1180_3 TaxID=2528832 RepID=UPI002406708F|nr:OmpA family protein [Vibrio sp. 1180_3]MDF9399123.1 OmpA family protein [Vibrio sp. 1180_3]